MTLELKRGLENRHEYAILHIRNDNPFECETKYSITGEAELFLCKFDSSPSSRLVPIKSDFFVIEFIEHTENDSSGAFSIRIIPKKRASINPLPPSIHEKPIVSQSIMKKSKHWIVIGYKEASPPYIGNGENIHERLSFPFDFKQYALPSIGAVDINGQPVFMKNNRDIELLISIKEAFSGRKYTKAYDLSKKAFEEYPDSVFASDFLRFQIKSLAMMDLKEHADEIIKLGKLFIKRYTSNEYLPEVLLILARVYSATGFVADANYFFDRLITEHRGTKYANLGMIYLGDMLYMNGKGKKAINYYLQAYYNAKDLNVASLAAYKLAIRNMEQGKHDEAFSYFEKIWKKNPDFLLRNIEDSYKITHELAREGHYDLAIDIAKALLKKLKKIDALYEQILFDIARWYDEKSDVDKAIQWYEKYLKSFPYGEHSDQVKKYLDELFVVSNDVNDSEALKKYTSLIDKYAGSEIADKALLAKLKIWLAQKRYKDILAAKEVVAKMTNEETKKRAKDVIALAANRLFAQSVKNGTCDKAIEAVENYGVQPDRAGDIFLIDCYIKYAHYNKAHKIIEKYLKKGSLKERGQWLCKDIDLLAAMNKYHEVLAAAQDLRTLLKEQAEKKCPTLLWDEVKAYDALGMYAKEMVLIHKMADLFKRDIRMAEVLRMGYNAAKKHGDAMQQLWLLQKLISLQNRLGAHPYSPWAEFEAIRVLKERKEYDRALRIALSMKKLPLKGEQKARWLYEQGVLFNLLNKKDASKKSFKECSKVKNSGAWGKLCVQALSVP